jgi:glycosyltransferase involved in cell wall biosynthesis
MFSIITPSFNSLEWLKRCARSVGDQGGDRTEHIVMDGGSRDGTREWLGLASGLRFVSEADKGMYDAVNKGLRMARGEILAYLNCDEQYLPGTLSAVTEWFSAHPRADLVFGHAMLVRPDGSLIACRKAYPVRWPYIVTDHLYTLSCGMFFRRRLVDDGFFFGEKLKDVGDADFVVRVLRAGCRAGVIDRYLSAFTMTGQNRSKGLVARDEANRFRAQAPFLIRGLKLPLKILRGLEKAVHGAYHQQAPFSYSLYTDGSAPTRTTFVADHASVRWPKWS